jgi:hypothetical protein
MGGTVECAKENSLFSAAATRPKSSASKSVRLGPACRIAWEGQTRSLYAHVRLAHKSARFRRLSNAAR